MAEAARDGFLVIGLGNPGGQYTATRHNVGFQVVDVLAARWNVDIRRPEFRALTAEAMLGRSMVLLMKPQTFMNASGRSAAEASTHLGFSPGQILAVYDDLDLPLGRIRLRAGGGSGGHRGVASMIEHLGTETFGRVRVGIGRPPEGRPVVDYVLSPFDPEEEPEAARAVARSADAVEYVIQSGLEHAMETFNVR